MTIGPEPSTRILWRSSLRGIGATSAGRPDRVLRRTPGIAPGEVGEELVEQPERVVRPRAGLRVVLHAAGGDVEQADALDRAVVEVHVGQLRLPEVRLQPLAGLAAHGEPVVLRGDGDAAGA